VAIKREGRAASHWRVLHWLLLQRLGWHRWVKGRVFLGDPIFVLKGEDISHGILRLVMASLPRQLC
jgi:hypothetical protein